MPLKAPSLRLWHNLGVPCWEQTEASIWFMSDNGFWSLVFGYNHTYSFVCMKIRKWLYHIPGSKLVPLHFWESGMKTMPASITMPVSRWAQYQYYDGSRCCNSTIAVRCAQCRSCDIQWCFSNQSHTLVTISFRCQSLSLLTKYQNCNPSQFIHQCEER